MNKDLLPFGIISVVYILLLSFREDLAWYFKPLLISSLIFGIKNFVFDGRGLLLGALLASLLGDTILMFADKGALFFVLGLIAFLLAHILYILLFVRITPSGKAFDKKKYRIGSLLVAVYLAIFLSYLMPHLGTMLLPVGIYGITISLMLILAWRYSLSITNPADKMVILGAILFVCSDSILAINKFVNPVNGTSILIMCTYIPAQFLLVSGILKSIRVES
ncbi:MAG: lysoplasmalogenase [Saprospiraceae bacterium]|nr:lysoplasmalogenase [Saprospiraceae bacterium]